MKTKFKILILLFISIVFSCNSKIDSSKEKDLDNNSQIDSNCNIHNEDCEKQAKDLGMTLDEYHIWSENQQKEIEGEDAMTDENGDIVDPNSSTSSQNQNIETQKQWVNCEHCHGAGLKLCYKCNGKGEFFCGSCHGTGTSHSTTGAYTCVDCNGRGVASCRVCYGKGTDGNCSYCDGRGQVLIEY